MPVDFLSDTPLQDTVCSLRLQNGGNGSVKLRAHLSWPS